MFSNANDSLAYNRSLHDSHHDICFYNTGKRKIFSNFLRKKNPKDIFMFQVGEEMEAEARNSLAFADFLVRPSDRGY